MASGGRFVAVKGGFTEFLGSYCGGAEFWQEFGFQRKLVGKFRFHPPAAYSLFRMKNLFFGAVVLLFSAATASAQTTRPDTLRPAVQPMQGTYQQNAQNAQATYNQQRDQRKAAEQTADDSRRQLKNQRQQMDDLKKQMKAQEEQEKAAKQQIKMQEQQAKAARKEEKAAKEQMKAQQEAQKKQHEAEKMQQKALKLQEEAQKASQSH